MSWESTELYYRKINTEIKRILGGHHSARLVLESVDFEEIKQLQHDGRWEETARILGESAQHLENAGADFILICTNTMHKVEPIVSTFVNIPIIHLADATAEQILSTGFRKVGFLGTQFSMEDDFYTGRLTEKYGLEVITPNEKDRHYIHHVIYNELCLGSVADRSRDEYLRIMNDLYQQGAQCIIEGCTEIVMLVDQSHTDIPLFDTTQIHAEKAAVLATSDTDVT
ncbi:UNVERIFIED_CONTAM: hypothetical protein GTU68_060555 [Idotea baltica]|nr:hypothetical protein [Idotea baltica]